MSTFVKSLVVALSISSLTFAGGTGESGPRVPRPTKLAHYEMGVYLTKDKAKLRINVDKELGGQVYVQLYDKKGTQIFERIMNSAETEVRLSLNLTNLDTGDYTLKVTNGLEMMIRDIKVTNREPVVTTRSITVL
ncbi:hypothetical protein ACFSUS_10150 [Spirosoma soli]|uniref:Secretion system C-terminal sorting domain-containing protein n=1 Tax=Spirosoma soli TaxID=1770529 RepID=A0ABW5M4G3_9BACT